MDKKISISNSQGLRATLLPYGATLVEVVFPDKYGRPTDLVLGFDTQQGYESDVAYLGRTVGRTPNRIKNGKFTLDDKEYQLTINKPPHSLHGGPHGVALREWSVHSHGPSSVTFRIVANQDIDELPGSVTIDVTYTVNDKNQLVLEHFATCESRGVLALTNHAYWNLDGSASIKNHNVKIAASEYLPTDVTNLPTGAILSVATTKFDLREEKPLRSLLDSEGHVNIDNDLVLDPNIKHGQSAFSLSSDLSGIKMDISTSYPVIHLYGAKFLNTTGKSGVEYGANKGFAIEAQYHSASLNYSNFPSIAISPGETYSKEIIYSFSHMDDEYS